MKTRHPEALGSRQARGLWGLLGTLYALSVQERGTQMPVVVVPTLPCILIAMHTLVILSETSLLVCGGNTSRSTGHPCWVIPFLRFEGLVRSFEKHRTSLELSPHFTLSPESVFFLVLFSRLP